MAQTRAGALKVAANRAGMTLDAYLTRIANGERRCTRCKAWKSVDQFGRDRTRPDGVDRSCFACRRVKERKVTKGRISAFRGRKHTSETVLAMSAARKGRPNIKARGKKRHIDIRIKMSRAARAAAAKGDDHHAYKDGKSAERHGLRATAEYKRWRYDVFSRDCFVCQDCGDNKGGNLNAHHIKPFADYPELRFDVANGITLCWVCHDRKHAAPVGRMRRRKARGQMILPL